VTAKKANRLPQSRAAAGPNLLDKLESHEAAAVLSGLLARHAELRPEAEAIARAVLGQVSMFTVAGEVEDALLQFDYDDLNGRAGGHSWGYVSPDEAAVELLEEAIEPFVAQMTRHLDMGLETEALEVCQGILLGLYQVRDGAGNDILGEADRERRGEGRRSKDRAASYHPAGIRASTGSRVGMDSGSRRAGG
jgi:hypothetical protein